MRVTAFFAVGRDHPSPSGPIRPLDGVGRHFAEVAQGPHGAVRRDPIPQHGHALVHRGGQITGEPVGGRVIQGRGPVGIAGPRDWFRRANDVADTAMQDSGDAAGTSEITDAGGAAQHVFNIVSGEVGGTQEAGQRATFGVVLVALLLLTSQHRRHDLLVLPGGMRAGHVCPHGGEGGQAGCPFQLLARRRGSALNGLLPFQRPGENSEPVRSLHLIGRTRVSDSRGGA